MLNYRLLNENGEEDHVMLMSMEEYRDYRENIPYRRNFDRSLEAIRYCKLEKYRNCLQGTMKIPGISNRKELSFGYYLRENSLIFVTKTGNLEEYIKKSKESLKECKSLLMYLLTLFEGILEEDFVNLQKLEEQMGSLEEKLIKKIPEHFDEIIMRYRKEFSMLHSYYQQLMDMGELMQDKMGQELNQEEMMYWQHFADRAERFHNNIEALREYLVQIRELYQSIIAEQQNRVMSFLTIITTIFFPLTLIAGWYGMNFPNMPEFDWKYGYPVVIGISVAILVLEIIYFKKKRML